LHNDYTPAVHKLVEIGAPALPRMLDLMLRDGPYDSFTREHVEKILWDIILKKCGGYLQGNERANALWKSLGSLNSDAPLAERERAVKLWREWLAKGQPIPGPTAPPARPTS
jgi:hypothetical protein